MALMPVLLPVLPPLPPALLTRALVVTGRAISRPLGPVAARRLRLAAGPKPFVIDWGETTHPAKTAPKGCKLVGLECHGSDAPKLGKLLRSTMGLQPLAPPSSAAEGAAGAQVEFCGFTRRTQGVLVAELETPKGRVKIGEAALARSSPASPR